MLVAFLWGDLEREGRAGVGVGVVGGVGVVAVEGVREAVVVGHGGLRTWMQSSSMGCDS